MDNLSSDILIEKLREETQRQARVFDSLLSATADFNYTFDRQGRFSYINQALLNLLGLTREQAVGRNFHDLNYPLELATRLQAQIEQVFITGNQLKDETPFTNPKGEWGYYEYIFVPLFDTVGRVEAVGGSTRDISEHKRAQAALKASEERFKQQADTLLESETRLADMNRNLEKLVVKRTEEVREKDLLLMQAQKLEAIGRLSGGVAHDFNNLITGILGITEDVRNQLGPDSLFRDDLDEVLKAAQKASSLTRQLLAFGRRQVIQQKVLNFNSVIVEMNRLFSRILGEDIVVTTALDPRLGNVKADHGQLEQVVVNLMLNARDAMPQGGKIILETANVELDEEYRKRHFDVVPGSYVALTITDNGIGIPAEAMNHLFEPFFTTKEYGKGAGLGLATVYGIIKQNMGDISVYSELGVGTTFRIYLPRITELAQIERRGPLRGIGPGGSERLLVVEDEDIVRRVAVKALRKRGYTVFEATHGDAALDMLSSLKEPLDLLITDVIMPGTNGRIVAEQLMQKQPGLPVLYMSGYPQNIILDRGILDPGTAFIEKSFSADAFCRKVREVLDTAQKSAEPQRTR